MNKFRNGSFIWIINSGGTNVGEEITFGSNDYDLVQAASQTPDGGYIISGYTYGYDSINGENDTWVVKFDSDLNELWVYTQGNEYGNGGESLVVAQNGDYLITASGYQWNEEENDTDEIIRLLRLNPSGELLWSDDYNYTFNTGTERAYSITETFNNNIVLAGSMGSDFGFVLKDKNSIIEVPIYPYIQAFYFDDLTSYHKNKNNCIKHYLYKFGERTTITSDSEWFEDFLEIQYFRYELSENDERIQYTFRIYESGEDIISPVNFNNKITGNFHYKNSHKFRIYSFDLSYETNLEKFFGPDLEIVYDFNKYYFESPYNELFLLFTGKGDKTE